MPASNTSRSTASPEAECLYDEGHPLIRVVPGLPLDLQCGICQKDASSNGTGFAGLDAVPKVVKPRACEVFEPALSPCSDSESDISTLVLNEIHEIPKGADAEDGLPLGCKLHACEIYEPVLSPCSDSESDISTLVLDEIHELPKGANAEDGLPLGCKPHAGEVNEVLPAHHHHHHNRSIRSVNRYASGLRRTDVTRVHCSHAEKPNPKHHFPLLKPLTLLTRLFTHRPPPARPPPPSRNPSTASTASKRSSTYACFVSRPASLQQSRCKSVHVCEQYTASGAHVESGPGWDEVVGRLGRDPGGGYAAWLMGLQQGKQDNEGGE